MRHATLGILLLLACDTASAEPNGIPKDSPKKETQESCMDLALRVAESTWNHAVDGEVFTAVYNACREERGETKSTIQPSPEKIEVTS